jgi:hypothetical protein
VLTLLVAAKSEEIKFDVKTHIGIDRKNISDPRRPLLHRLHVLIRGSFAG